MQAQLTRYQLHDKRAAGADLAYWLAQPVQARLDALEALRRQHVQGTPDADLRLQRVCRLVQLKPG
jgi:HAMP domain-containing protein